MSINVKKQLRNSIVLPAKRALLHFNGKNLSLTSHAQFLGNLDSCGALSLVQLGDNSVSRMGNNGTEDTSDVTCSKGHH